MGTRYGGAASSCDSSVRDPMLLICLAFILLTVLVVNRVLKTNRGQTHVGCQLSFLATLWINYLFAPLTYLLPGYCGVFPELEVPGALVCLYSLAAFTAGSFFLPGVFGVRSLKNPTPIPPVPNSLRKGLLLLGFLFFITDRLGIAFPGVQAVLAGGEQLLIVAIVLNIWEAARAKQNNKVVLWVGLGFIFPINSLINDGFLNVGMVALAPVLIFATTCVGKKDYLRIAFISVIGLYLGLSFFATYAHNRNDIRASVWGGDRLANRVQQFTNLFENFEWFSLGNPDHLDAVTGRLNQTWLVGAGVTYVDNTKEWAYGATLKDAALAFIPRLIWKDKPQQGGSSLVSRYTGLAFSEGTSVPMGQILELYVNFGVWSVVIGFAIVGGLLAYLDMKARNALSTGAFNTFVSCFIVSNGLHNVGNEFVTVVTQGVVGLGLTYVLQHFMRMKFSKRRRQLANANLSSRSYPGGLAAFKYSK
jgi:hypothetical protein